MIILDQLRDNLSEGFLLKFLLDERPDILGLNAYTKDIFHIKELITKIRPILPTTKILLGGVQMSLMPSETFGYLQGYIDYGFAGESESGFSKFVEAVEGDTTDDYLSEIPNLVWRSQGNIKVNPGMLIYNLDDLPFPRWDLMPPATYPKAPHGAFYRQYPFAPIITSRGCPYPCTFCSAGTLSGKKIRYRTVENVIEEIKYLQKDFGVKEIHIEDDNFSLKKERVIEFSERVLKEELGITWALPNGLRLDNLDQKTLKLMSKAGCYTVNVGIESGNDKRLKDIQKNITKEKIRAKIAMAKEAGIDIGGFFIIGFPDETLEEINDTIKFATELELDRIGISYFQPYPGTKEYQKLCETGEYKFNLDKSRHSLHTITYVPKNLSEKKLKSLRFKAFIKFYFRPRIFIKLLKEVKSLEHFRFILKRGLRWLTN